MCSIGGNALPVVEHGWVVGVEEEVLDAVHGDNQPRDEGTAQLQVADEPILGDPCHGAAQEEVVEPVKTKNRGYNRARLKGGPQVA